MARNNRHFMYCQTVYDHKINYVSVALITWNVDTEDSLSYAKFSLFAGEAT